MRKVLESKLIRATTCLSETFENRLILPSSGEQNSHHTITTAFGFVSGNNVHCRHD